MNSTTRSIVLVCLIDGLVGLSFGMTAGHLDIPAWLPFTLALFVLAGASEFLFISVVATGGSPITGALAGILVNGRHLPFGMLVKSQVEQGALRWLGCHIMNDESVAFALSQHTPQEKHYAYWLCGVGILICWPFSILIGSLLSQSVINLTLLGLDALFPCLIIALVMPSLDTKKKSAQAIVGALIALITTPFLPSGLPILLAISAMFLIRKQGEDT